MSSFQTRNQHNQNIFTMGLIYQSNVEISAGPSAEIILRQASHVIHETFVCRQSHHTNDCILINVTVKTIVI